LLEECTVCVFIRELSAEEGNRLLSIIRRGNNVVSSRRAEIVLASAQGMKAPDIARLYHCAVDHVRDVIHRFNDKGFNSLKPAYGGGRPPVFGPEQRSALVELALTPPQFAGFPWTSWSLSKLQEAAIKRKITKSISTETIRLVLEEAGVSYQRTKTWKESNDPEFEAKKNGSRNSTGNNPPTDE
jgi:transposase